MTYTVALVKLEGGGMFWWETRAQGTLSQSEVFCCLVGLVSNIVNVRVVFYLRNG